MEVQMEGNQFTAVVKRAAEVMCRLSVVRPDGNEAAARAALADKARFWIFDYLQRSEPDHESGDTDAIPTGS
ncbi:MAG: hypothetical protein JSS14_21220 [Proteobacteria bacterium]|nr:hypothetical protein [Pseudomonadota bacterium]